ncbi:MAG: hypothetical protein HYV07_26480 [Deltaproteobacteria bacterium]|nr:hypothetical protein [Deltaproteobacteria bacterium]
MISVLSATLLGYLAFEGELGYPISEARLSLGTEALRAGAVVGEASASVLRGGGFAELRGSGELSSCFRVLLLRSLSVREEVASTWDAAALVEVARELGPDTVAAIRLGAYGYLGDARRQRGALGSLALRAYVGSSSRLRGFVELGAMFDLQSWVPLLSVGVELRGGASSAEP